jgi:hypothetical protein
MFGTFARRASGFVLKPSWQRCSSAFSLEEMANFANPARMSQILGLAV